MATTTGKTGADAYLRSIQRQARILAKYGPKLLALVEVLHGAGTISDVEYTAITTALNAVIPLAAAMAKVANESGFAPRFP